MDYALAMTIDYVQMPHAWIAVFTPGALSLLALVLLRRTLTSFSWTVPLALAGTAITWWSAWWVETPTSLGLHFYPATLIMLLVAWSNRIIQEPSLAKASRWAACLAGFTWFSLLPVDVAGCMASDGCVMVSVGGAGIVDLLVLCPAVAFAAVLLVWAAFRPRRQQAVA